MIWWHCVCLLVATAGFIWNKDRIWGMCFGIWIIIFLNWNIENPKLLERQQLLQKQHIERLFK